MVTDGCVWRGAAAGADAAAGAASATLAAIAASTSRCTMAPPGPLPVSDAISMPCCFIIRRANGVDRGLPDGGARTDADLVAACDVPSAFAVSSVVAVGAGFAAAPPESAPSRTIRGSRTIAISPSPKQTSVTVPSSKASTSKVAFSDSTSATISPFFTLSPTLTFMAMTRPSVRS